MKIFVYTGIYDMDLQLLQWGEAGRKEIERDTQIIVCSYFPKKGESRCHSVDFTLSPTGPPNAPYLYLLCENGHLTTARKVRIVQTESPEAAY